MTDRRRPPVPVATAPSCASSSNGSCPATSHAHDILGGLAEFERTLIQARTGEGRERAKARGVKFGRPAKLSQHQRREAIERLNAGEAITEIARTVILDLSRWQSVFWAGTHRGTGSSMTTMTSMSLPAMHGIPR